MDIYYFNWRDTHGLMNPIRHQGKMGVCWAFAITAALEAKYFLTNGSAITLSPQDLVNNFLSPEQISLYTTHLDSEGGYTACCFDVLQWIKYSGCVSEISCRYVGRRTAEMYNPAARLVQYRLDDFEVINYQNVKEKLREQPLIIDILVGENFIFLGRDDVYSGSRNIWNDPFEKTQLHSVLLVGYGRMKRGIETLRYWIVKNSWGADWSDNGYGKISRQLFYNRRSGCMEPLVRAIFAPKQVHQIVCTDISNEDNCTKVADAASSRLYEGKAGSNTVTSEAYSKSIRLDHDPMVSCNTKESVQPSGTQASTVVPQEAVVQHDSLTPGGFRTSLSDIMNMSTSLEINNHPTQAATQSGSLPHLYSDPLDNEIEKICKEINQAVKDNEDTKLQLQSDCEKELEEVRRKYDIKLRDIEVEYQQTQNVIHTNINLVLVNQKLAEAVRSKCTNSASGMQIDARLSQQLVQHSGQQSGFRSPLATGSSSGRPPPAAARSQYSFPPASSQNMAPSIQASPSTNLSARSL